MTNFFNSIGMSQQYETNGLQSSKIENRLQFHYRQTYINLIDKHENEGKNLDNVTGCLSLLASY